MASTQTLFFATKEDLLPVFAAVERSLGLQYVRTGLFASAQPEVIHCGDFLPQLGVAPGDSTNLCPRYLVTMAEMLIKVRRIPQRDGGVKFGIDQLENPDSIVLQTGGRFSSSVFLHGSIGTISSTNASRQTYKVFHSSIGKEFRRIKAFFVGVGCLALLETGVRLTAAAQSPKDFDLSL